MGAEPRSPVVLAHIHMLALPSAFEEHSMLFPSPGRTHSELLRLYSAGNLGVYLSQFGEDVALWHLLRERQNGFYVDVGCYHPERASNTAIFQIFLGWRGINIDPDERVIEQFLKSRGGDVNLCCAVGREADSAEMRFFEDSSVNTFSDELAAGHIQQNRKMIGKRQVQIRTLSEILSKHLPPGQKIDLLDIDAEGHDLAVLEGNDWTRFRPEVVTVEDFELRLSDVHSSGMYQLLSGQGYRLFSHIFSTSIYTQG